MGKSFSLSVPQVSICKMEIIFLFHRVFLRVEVVFKHSHMTMIFIRCGEGQKIRTRVVQSKYCDKMKITTFKHVKVKILTELLKIYSQLYY